MKRFSSLVLAAILGFLSCAEEPLDNAIAEKHVRETVAKMPAPGVTVYVGAMTDETYVPTYRAIAADKKFLLFEESVFIKEANRKMPRITLTGEGEKLFVCEKNRCTAPVCSLSVTAIEPPKKVGREWQLDYTVETKCAGEAYAALKTLADRQFVKPSTQRATLFLLKKDDSFEVRIP